MTDKQIEEALKYCAIHDFTNYCDKCPLNSIMGCRNELMIKAFDTIQKLKEERIDRLKEENAGTPCRWCEDTIRKNAVKEFAKKLKDGVADYLYKTNFDGHKDNIVDIFELCEIVDSIVKEYEECGVEQKE